MAEEGKTEKIDELAGFEVIENPGEEKPTEETTDTTETVEGEPKPEGAPTENPTEEKPSDINDEAVLEYFKKKGVEVESLDDLLAKKEEPKDPWEDVIDDEDKAYFKYKRETGRSRKEFNYLKEDISKKDALEISIDRLRKETGLNLTTEEAKEYLEEALQIDLSDEESSVRNKIALNKYAKPRRDELLAEQEKYRTPTEEKTKSKPNAEMVTLENGAIIEKEKYDALLKQDEVLKQDYIKNVTEAVNNVAPSEFNITIDDNGENKELKFIYEHSKEDKHSMLSDVVDVNKMIETRYQSEKGFNHQQLANDLWMGKKENIQKVVGAAMQFARAEAIKEFVSNSNNENFSGKPLPQKRKTEDGYTPIEELR